MTRRPPFWAVLVLIAAFVVVGTLGLTSMLSSPQASPDSTANANATPTPADVAANATPTPIPTPRPKPGHEVFGFVPYWVMDDGIAAHLAKTDLTTLALFSVTNRRNGTINDGLSGYRKITGAIGDQLIREAHDRGTRVELVFTSFGVAKNKRLFGGTIELQDKVIAELAKLADDIGVDGVNVDVEVMDTEDIGSYGAFVGRLREALKADHKRAQVSVATTANRGGAAMAAAAAAAGADRIFMMGYDYHWSGSAPGASAPMDRLDGNERDLLWSLDLYEAAGVPIDRTLLGLPLYGMAWPVDSAEPDAAQTGDGDAWVPAEHQSIIADDSIEPTLEPVEVVEIYHLPTTGADGKKGWQVVYVDSPRTLKPKLALADDRGLAGAGFWAIGFERGQPATTKLINRFGAGKLGE